MNTLLNLLSRAVVVLLIGIGAELTVMLVSRAITRGITASVGQQDRTTTLKARRRSTLQSLLVNSVRYFVYFFALLMVLGHLGVNWQPLLAGAGIVGLAVGFGAQRLVRDIISGLFLLLEDQFAVGDYVSLGALSGEVVDMGLRTTRLRDDSGRICTVANGDIVQTCNYSRGAYRLVVPFAVDQDTDLQAVRKLVGSMAEEYSGREDVEVAPSLAGPMDISAGRVQLVFTAEISPAERESLGAEMRQALLERLRKADIRVI